MAYFIVIGTDNNVQSVVDEVRESHLQHNVVTSGCVISKGDELYYHWDVYNAQGDKKQEGEHASIALKDALNNQIAQFNAVLPADASPNVFLIGSCHTEEDANRIKFVYKSLNEIGGATLNTISIDIVLLGYNLNSPDDVTVRPHWKNLRNFQGIENGKFVTDVLYVNNIDYEGAATNIDDRLLGRFLSHWAKMTSSGGVNPKLIVKTQHYAIGLAERQYNFEDIVPFFKFAAEERILDRALHDVPAQPTQQMLEKKYYKNIDLTRPWVDGLNHIKDTWRPYCTTEFEYEKAINEQPYSLAAQHQQLAIYLNSWLQLYCIQQQRDIDALNNQIAVIDQEITELKSQLSSVLNVNPGTEENKEPEEYNRINQCISEKENEREELQQRVQVHNRNINHNSFSDSRTICNDLAAGLLTDAQNDLYRKHLNQEKELFDYLHTDRAVTTINETIDRAIQEGDAIPVFPQDVIDNVGRLEPLAIPSPLPPISEERVFPPKEERNGCIGWLTKLFHRNNTSVIPPVEEKPNVPATTALDIKNVHQQVVSAIKEFRKVKDAKEWWNTLCKNVEEKGTRLKECRTAMDGIIHNIGTSRERREGGFSVPFNKKSISLIDVDRVRAYRDSGDYYLKQIEVLKDRYFDASIEDSNRQSMQQLIKHQVIDALRGIWHTLHWDGTNPFCNELLSDEDIHNFIENPENGTQKQSKPFVEYVKLGTQNIAQSINYLFYFSHPGIERQANVFRDKYHVSEGTLTPVFLPDLTNSICQVQVLDITDHIDNLADFKPRTEAQLFESQINYAEHVNTIVGTAVTKKEKAKAIFDWLCNNIAYDTTLQIHDADRCWKTRRGVCQAYCELFLHLAKAVGITADIIVGKSKNPDGIISEENHAWIFVYTKGYDGIFIDPTWGAGYVQNGIFKAEANDIWFDIDPDWLIYTHFADDKEWNQKASAEVSYEQFEKLPYSCPSKDKDGKDSLYESLAHID